MNKSILVGRLVRDPEIRYSQTENGELAVASFRIAVDRKFVRKDGVKTDYKTSFPAQRLGVWQSLRTSIFCKESKSLSPGDLRMIIIKTGMGRTFIVCV